MTNYERIKTLSIEELATFMAQVRANRLDSLAFTCRTSKIEENLEWLKKETPKDDEID